MIIEGIKMSTKMENLIHGYKHSITDEMKGLFQMIIEDEVSHLDLPKKLVPPAAQSSTEKRCAICQKVKVSMDLCNNCYEEWVIDGVYPEWVKAAIQEEKHWRYTEGKEKTLNFSDLDENFVENIPSEDEIDL
jgi:hypothetical protein